MPHQPQNRTPPPEDVGAVNQSQRESAQAQDVAQDALHAGEDPGEDTEKGGSDGLSVIPQDEPDLIDRMNQMVSSGHIDTGAFDGERNDDDEESDLGPLDSQDSDDPGLGNIGSSERSG